MMINKRLIHSVGNSKKYIVENVLCQWTSLLSNIVMMYVLTAYIGKLSLMKASFNDLIYVWMIVVIVIIIRSLCTYMSQKLSFLSSKEVKKTMRKLIYEKLLRLGASYKNDVNTSQIVQVALEGVDQLETYFGAYLPQLFYALLAPITLFIVMARMSLLCAFVLLICVPLIPVTIILIQKFAKKLLDQYWGQYETLGDSFLENLQGLTTLKIYQADEYKQEEMDKEAEKFRKITMKVLTMQLNSITVMDVIAYGGAVLGIIIAVSLYHASMLSLQECLFIILISAEYFLPMRLLGSFFHIAMNGMAASDKIFALLDLKEHPRGHQTIKDTIITCHNLSFAYETDYVLSNINMEFKLGLSAIVGKSGCGKSTLASLIMKYNQNYSGSLKIGEYEISDINESSIMDHITYVSYHSYLFKGTVKDNLFIAKENATDQELWNVLERVNLSNFFKQKNGLETMLQEGASNLSGGQRQRLALARALLHDTPIYIFDEATSNIDIESENVICKQIYALAKHKVVIMISHRLENVIPASIIYVLDQGILKEKGTHQQLLDKKGIYESLYMNQYNLEHEEVKA